jgi:hypothetical protein
MHATSEENASSKEVMTIDGKHDDSFDHKIPT